jgi:molybdate transport system permease protein
MLGLLALPVFALLISSSPSDLMTGIRHPLFGEALWLSAWTSTVSLGLVIVAGTPLAWWLSRTGGRIRRVAEVVVALPIILPPAVVGIALLQAFGRGGVLGSLFIGLDVQVPFTTLAVVIAQTVVAAPFYIEGAAAALRRVDDDLLLVARTLGQSPRGAFMRVAVPLALPGLLGGAALAWARALGEFGATLLFAGNLPGTTQTMPLAIYQALESDVRVAIALSLVLVAVCVVLLFALRFVPSLFMGSVPDASREGRP